jgi:hypothetical protein
MSCINYKTDEPLVQTAATSNEEFLKSLRESWASPYEDSAFLKDIPRLVRRVQVQTRDGVLHGPAAEESSKVEALVWLVELLSRELGAEEEAVRAIRGMLDR